MAIDTREKRQSVVAIGSMSSGPTITPDASFSAFDRSVIGYGYGGVLAISQSTLTAGTGSFTLTGIDATLTLVGVTTLTAETGTFALAGNAAALTASRLIGTTAGTFSLTGNDATFTQLRSLAVEVGTFSLTGNDATLTASRLIGPEVGVFLFIGNDATLTQQGPITTATRICIRNSTLSSANASATLARATATASITCTG